MQVYQSLDYRNTYIYLYDVYICIYIYMAPVVECLVCVNYCVVVVVVVVIREL